MPRGLSIDLWMENFDLTLLVFLRTILWQIYFDSIWVNWSDLGEIDFNCALFNAGIHTCDARNSGGLFWHGFWQRLVPFLEVLMVKIVIHRTLLLFIFNSAQNSKLFY